MRKLFQTEWHGIPFQSFAKLTHSQLAGMDFYAAFYAEFYRRKKSWQDLDPAWVKIKMQIADHILNRIEGRKPVLSIGCGLGLVERELIARGIKQLEATEVSETPLRWALQEGTPLPLYVGLFPQCMPPQKKYGFIYCGDIDYCFNDTDWITFLKSMRPYLLPQGRLLIMGRKMENFSAIQKLLLPVKDVAKTFLRVLNLRQEQFWGWSRTPAEYAESLKNSGLVMKAEGFLPNGTYWIEAE